MTEVEKLAQFVAKARLADLSTSTLMQLKIRVLDTVGVAIGALDGEPIERIRRLTETLGGKPHATLIGGGKTAPDRAAFFNGALSRYLDYMDSYLAPGETCHPSDNFGAVLAAAETRGASGAEFLVALAVAYQVQIRLSDVAPVRHKGFDHTTQGAYAAAAGAARALGLDRQRIANAIAISGTANNALRVTRTGSLSNWKGLAYPNAAMSAVHAAMLARYGITGPAEVFEGNKGFKQTIAGPFEIDWSNENIEAVARTVVKKYNAEVHSQSAIDAALDIQRMPGFSPNTIRQIRLKTFQVAYQIIGGGEEGDKRIVRSKEDADHSLPYMLAVALIDGQVEPEQYCLERIRANDVQDLLKHVTITPDPALSAQFPDKMPALIEVEFADGRVRAAQRDDYEGFHTRPFNWLAARKKFNHVTERFLTAAQQDAIANMIASLDERPIGDLTALLRRVRIPTALEAKEERNRA